MRCALIGLIALIALTACGTPGTANAGPTQTRQAELDQMTAVASRPTATQAPIVVVIATQPPTATATPDAGIPTYWALIGDVLAQVHTIVVDVAMACDAPDNDCTVAQAQGQSRYITQTDRLKGLNIPTPCKAVDRAVSNYIIKGQLFVLDIGVSLAYKPTQAKMLQQQSGDLDVLHTAFEQMNAAINASSCKP